MKFILTWGRSLPDMGNIFMLLMIVMFIFAIVGLNLGRKPYGPECY